MSGAKSGDRQPDEDDDALELFRAAVGDATPLSTDRVHHELPPPPAIPRQRQQDEQAALRESIAAPDLLDLHLEGGDEAAWLRPGMSPSVLRDLRRGRWVVQAHLDLHGMNRDEARTQFGIFLVECVNRGHRCVRIVHGKGLGSPGREPILKRLVQGWLSQSKAVLAFCHARPSDGGSGAVVVLLSPPQQFTAGRKA
jgi:DNA-nicking Smr family endonuclease